MRVDLLGPMRVLGEDGEITLNAAKERSLLAALALRAGRAVSTDELVSALWGDVPPDSARKTLQTYVSNLRRVLGPDLIDTEPLGYVLQSPPESVDVLRFRSLIASAAAASRSGSTGRARQLLVDAVELWRGEPFNGVAAHTPLALEATRLKEEYLSALEARVDADLAAGQHTQAIGDLEVLIGEHPFRERLWGQLMVALYRSGRQADALATYSRARHTLRDELGLEPCGELRGLERAILSHDPCLGLSSDAVAPDGQRSEPMLMRSPIRYAVTPDGVHVAYQIYGDGPSDIVIIPGYVSHLDLWSEPPVDQLVRRLASGHRLIILDRRGSGLSDRPTEVTPNAWVVDTLAVLDTVGSTRAMLLGFLCGGSIAAMFAAIHPDRTSGLVMWGASPRFVIADGYPFGVGPKAIESFASHVSTKWGAGISMELFAPGFVADADARAFWARYQRVSASPGAAAAFARALAEFDIRDILAQVTAPTLVLHAARDAVIPAGAGRIMAQLIPLATYVELDSDIHMLWLSDVVEQITSEILSFIAKTLPDPSSERVLATVLAVCGSAANRHGPEIAKIVQRHHGRLQPPTGTATFDRPGRALRCGLEIVSALDAGAAIHIGECELLANGDVIGIAVDAANHLAETSASGQVLVTQTIRDLLAGSEVDFLHVDRRRLGSLAGQWEVHLVVRP